MTIETESPRPDRVDDDLGLPVEALDLALAPLRRVVWWASADVDQRLDGVRYLESTSMRWLQQAGALELPEPIRDRLDGLKGDLEGFDTADRASRRARILALRRAIGRMDSLLGLPLQHKPARPVRRDSRAKGPRKKTERPTESPARPSRPSGPPPVYWDGAMDVVLADLPGTSAALAAGLAARGVERVSDLLFLRPIGRETVSPVQGAGRSVEAGRVALSGRIVRRSTHLLPDGTRIPKVTLVGAGPAEVTLRAGAYLEPLTLSSKATFVGHWEPEANTLTEAEWTCSPSNGTVHLQEYGLEGVEDADVRSLMVRLLPHLPTVLDPIPSHVANRAGVIGLRDALSQLQSGANGDEARQRLGFQEALFAHIGLAWGRYHGPRERPLPVGVLHSLAGRLVARSSFSLGDEQQIALEDLKRDLLSGRPMRRVLTGEVGVGKGAVALQLAVTVAENKGQVMLLYPDSSSAALRFGFAAPLIREAGLVARVVEGELSDAMRDALSRGEVHLLFGSLDLLEQNIEFRRLGLVIAEENGPWGGAMRSALRLPKPRPHTLVVTSTPVGAAVSMAAYPAAEWTVLEASERNRVAVQVHASGARAEAYAPAAAAVSAGRQAIVVFPLINGQDALGLRDALSVVHALQEEHFGGSQVGLFHGSMTREERRRAFEDFRNRRLDVLVATTSIEDGPALPNVSVVVVEQAARVDLGRLQRIGGYVASSPHAPQASLVVEDPDAGFEERFGYVERSTDGFVINDHLVAEDPDVYLSEGAAPLPQFAFLDLSRDRMLIWRARQLAHQILSKDPDLRQGWSAEVGRWVREAWDRLWPSAPASWVCPVQENASQKKRRRRRRRKR